MQHVLQLNALSQEMLAPPQQAMELVNMPGIYAVQPAAQAGLTQAKQLSNPNCMTARGIHRQAREFLNTKLSMPMSRSASQRDVQIHQTQQPNLQYYNNQPTDSVAVEVDQR